MRSTVWMRSRWCAGMAALFCLAPLPAWAQTAPETTPEKVRAALPELERLAGETVQRSGVPGMAIAVVYQDKVVYLKGFGVREAGKTQPVDPDTVFQLASMSKPIAGTVVAALIGKGLVSWDDPVIRHDPDFRLSDPWVTSEVTIRDLFCHRSGLPGTAGDDLEEVGYARPEILRRLRYLRPASSFRSHYAYSNFGLTEGGVAAARAACKEWETAAADALYKPLGMTRTSSRFADYERAGNRALLHVLVDGKWVARFTREPDPQSPAGGVSSTARDLAQWMRLELSGGKWNGEQLIAADALAETHIPQIVRGLSPVTGKPSFYGLGWGVDYDARGRIFWEHAGAFSLGARTKVSLLPAEDLGIVVLANAFPTGVPDGIIAAFYDLALNGKLTRDWIDFWNKPYDALFQSFYAASKAYATAPAHPSPALPPVAYVGTYANDYFGPVEVREQAGGALTLHLGPQKRAFPLRHWDRDLFLYEPSPELPGALSGVTFTLGADRKARQLVIENINDDGQGTFTRVPAQQKEK